MNLSNWLPFGKKEKNALIHENKEEGLKKFADNLSRGVFKTWKKGGSEYYNPETKGLDFANINSKPEVVNPMSDKNFKQWLERNKKEATGYNVAQYISETFHRDQYIPGEEYLNFRKTNPGSIADSFFRGVEQQGEYYTLGTIKSDMTCPGWYYSADLPEAGRIAGDSKINLGDMWPENGKVVLFRKY